MKKRIVKKSLKKKIKLIFSSGYNSAPHVITKENTRFLIKNDCECTSCGQSIFKLDDFPVIDISEGYVYCEECDRDHNYSTCSVCEELFFKPKEPKEHFFIVSKENEREAGMDAGLYQVVKFPFFYGSILTGFDAFFEDSIKLIRTLNINSIQRVRWGNDTGEVSCDYVCPECVDLLTGKSRITNNYCNKSFGMHHCINVRGAIKRGY